MNFDAYALTAVDIVNARVSTCDDLLTFLTDGTGTSVSPRDLVMFRRVQARLRAVFVHGATGSDNAAVEELNGLLATFPVRPQISRASGTSWNLQLTGRSRTCADTAPAMTAERMARAAWGLASWMCEHGASRFGICADQRCGNVYLDTSSNCRRRFCSERCATRAHVAAHRARKRAELAEVG